VPKGLGDGGGATLAAADADAEIAGMGAPVEGGRADAPPVRGATGGARRACAGVADGVGTGIGRSSETEGSACADGGASTATR
jgi:hypothetical protein